MISAVIFSVLALILGFLAWRSWQSRNRILSTPVVSASDANSMSGVVTVSGKADGTPIVSPWTGVVGILFDATHKRRRVIREHDGGRRHTTDSRHLGTVAADDFCVTDRTAKVTVAVDENTTLRHLENMDHEDGFSGDLSGGFKAHSGIQFGSGHGGRHSDQWINETWVEVGEPLWVTGDLLLTPGNYPQLGGDVIVSSLPPEAQGSSLLKATVGLAVAGASCVILGVLGAVGVIG